MNNYKNYLKKSVQAYAYQKLNATETVSPKVVQLQNISVHSQNGVLNVSTPLPNAYLQHLFMFILASAAVCLVYQIRIPTAFASAISIFIVFSSSSILIKTIRSRQIIRRLQCFNHTWLLFYVDGTEEKLEIQSISRGLGLLYILNFVSQDSKKTINVCIWKYQSPREFLAYCSQLLFIGKKD